MSITERGTTRGPGRDTTRWMAADPGRDALGETIRPAGPPDDGPHPARRWRRRLFGAVAVLVLVVVATLLLVARAWGADVRAQEQLLPGAIIAGVDVGLLDRDAALAAAGEAVAAALDHVVVVQADGREWTVDARSLGAGSDLEELVATALRASHDASLIDLVGFRWLGSDAEVTLDATVTLPDDAVATWVAGRARQVDRDPVDATIGWEDGTVTTTPAATGFTLDQQLAADHLHTALLTRQSDPLALPHTITDPQVDDATVAAARDGAEQALAAALGHEVTLRHADGSWTTTPADLDAVPDGAAVVAEALRYVQVGNDPAAVDVPLEVPDAAIDGLLGDVAASLRVTAVNATVEWSGGTVRRIAGREGRALDRSTAADELRDALTGTATEVALQTPTVRPGRDVSELRDVLVVHQSRRVVELYRGDQVLRSWPVAVGTGGSPTPTGTFVVGAKRYEPTWVNPAPTRWGKDLPARIGPGPDNPLGLRALNWNRPGGGDTLIRFHGTPNEDSIGEAASNGCVRMFNADVIELYDLVRTGTMIISRA